MYTDAYSFKKVFITAYLPGMYRTNTVVNNRVLIRHKGSNLPAGWLPIKPRKVRSVVICQQVIFS